MANNNFKILTKWLNQIRIVTNYNYYKTTINCLQRQYNNIPYKVQSGKQSSSTITQWLRQYYTGKSNERLPPKVVHDRGAQRFYIDFKDIGKAYINYDIQNNTIKLLNTFVPEEMRGHQIAEKMAEAVFVYVKENNLKVVAECSYIKRYMEKHKMN